MYLQIKERLGKNKDILCSFILCGIAMYIFSLISVTTYPQTSTLITGDVLGQYIPAIRNFVKDFWKGENLDYSWNLFLGMNATGFYSFYVGGSIINIIYIVLPWLSPETFYCIAIVLKTALAGATFVLFSKKVLNIQGTIPVFFSLFYAMCGFQMGINIIHYIWMDAMYLLPLIIVLITDYIKYGRWRGLVLAYTYLFFCNFYMGYVVGFFSALYLVLHVIVFRDRIKEAHANIMNLLIKYAVQVLLAVGMVAAIIFPLAYVLFVKSPGDATTASANLVQHNILLLLSRFFFGIEVSNYEKLPYLYVGIPTFLLIIFFFLCKEIHKKERCFWGILSLIMVLSGMCLPLYLFWHGFDNPDSWYHRYSYILAFLCAAMACKVSVHLKKIGLKRFLCIGFLELILSIGILLYGVEKNKFQSHNIFWWNIGLIVLWLVVFCTMICCSLKWKKVLIAISINFAMLEVVSNGCIEDRFFQNKEVFQAWQEENLAMEALLAEDPTFFRIQNVNSIGYNTDSWMGSRGLEDFWSFENYTCKHVLGELGMFVSPRYMDDSGLNPVTQLLLGVKYKIRNSGADDIKKAGASISYYPYSLGLGYLVDEEIIGFTLQRREDSMDNVFINCNRLLNAMCKVEDVFIEVPDEELRIEEQGIKLEKREEDYLLYMDTSYDGTQWINFCFDKIEEEIYVSFECNNTILYSDLPRMINYNNPIDENFLGVRFSKQLELIENIKMCTIAMLEGITETQRSISDIQFYYVNLEAYEKVYEELARYPLNINAFKNGYVEGTVSVPSQEKVLFTSIPYDEGWKISVVDDNTGEEVTDAQVLALLDQSFLGIKFPYEGRYHIILSYSAPWSKVGKVVSVISWIIYFFLIVLKKETVDVKSENDCV